MIALALSDPGAAGSLGLAPQGERARAVAIATWRGRMINESQSAYVFDSLAAQLAEAGYAEEAEEARAFAAEERRHGRDCASVVEALGGDPTAEIDPELAVPSHRAVSRLEAIARNVLSIGCLSETVAVALIGAERAEMPAGPLRDRLDGIWADEIGHARFGWRFLARALPRLEAPERARLGAYLRVALRELEAHEIAHLPAGQPDVSPDEARALGICSGPSARALFYSTVTTVILPRLEALGLPADAAWRARAARSRVAAPSA